MKAMRILAAAATLSVGDALTQHVEERKLMSYVSYTTYHVNKVTLKFFGETTIALWL